MRARHQKPDERGNALILAIILLTVVGMIAVASLNHVYTSARISNATLGSHRSSGYAAESAMQTAIEYLEDNPGLAGDYGMGCPTVDYTDPDGTAVTVDVCPQSGSYISTTGPRAVVLALGTHAQEGIILGNNGKFLAYGNIFSNSKIQVGTSNSYLFVALGNIWAKAGCVGTIHIDDYSFDYEDNPGIYQYWGDEVDCNVTGSPTVGADPNYAAASTTVPAGTPVIPACAGGSTTLSPGAYRIASQLSTIACDVVLSPGVYFLDFPSAGVWDIDRRVTASCDGGGVQLIMGGDSQISVDDGELNICGRQATPTSPRIAVYGLKDAIANGSPQSIDLDPTAATSTSSPAFSSPNNVINFSDGSQSSISSVPHPRTVFINSTGYSQQTTGTGATLNARARHREANGTPSVIVTAADGTTCTKTLPVRASLTTDTVALNCSGFNEITPFTVRYQLVTTSSGASAGVDGLDVQGSYTVEGIRETNGCVVSNPGASPTRCAVLKSITGGDGWYVIGVVYVPEGYVDLTGNPYPPYPYQRASTDGIVAQSIEAAPSVDGYGAWGGDGDPDLSDGDVLLSAKISGQTWVSSHVTFPESSPSSLAIESWVNNR
jgi:hypothetical protein